MWTTVPPAKSRARESAAQRGVQESAFAPHHVRHREVHHQHHSTMNSSMALNFMRSAKAPEIRAGVMMANMN